MQRGKRLFEFRRYVKEEERKRREKEEEEEEEEEEEGWLISLPPPPPPNSPFVVVLPSFLSCWAEEEGKGKACLGITTFFFLKRGWVGGWVDGYRRRRKGRVFPLFPFHKERKKDFKKKTSEEKAVGRDILCTSRGISSLLY